MRVLIISFSGRAGGNCDRISDLIHSSYAGSIVFRFSEHQIQPCGSCQYEFFADAGACPHVDDAEYGLLEAVCRSDLVYFVIPNYCDYPCANYFIFNERSQCYFQGYPERLDEYLNVRKKFVVISNTNQDHFKEILAQQAVCEPEILFLSAKKFGKSSVSGDLTDSGNVRDTLERFCKE